MLDPSDSPEQTPDKLAWVAPTLRELPFGATASGDVAVTETGLTAPAS